MSNHHTIVIETQKYNEIHRRILESEINIDDVTLNDTLEGATNIHELIAEILRSALQDEALTSGLNDYLEKMKARQVRFKRRSAKKRELALWVLQETSVPRMEFSDFTVSLRTCPQRVLVEDEGLIPNVFKLPQPAKVNKASLSNALKNGNIIPGASLSEKCKTLSLRVN